MRVVYGMNPVRELLRSGADGVTELWLAEGGERPRAFADLEKGARERGAKVRVAPRSKLDRLAGVTQHQGIVAVVADYRYRELDEILAAAGESGRPPLLVLLDGVEDPHNLGAIVRSAHALGAHGVVMPRDRAAGVTPSAAKASAGAVEHMAIARVTNLVRCIEELREFGDLDGRHRPRRGGGALLGRPPGTDRARPRGGGAGDPAARPEELRPRRPHPHAGQGGQPERLGRGGHRRSMKRRVSAAKALARSRLDKPGSVLYKTPLRRRGRVSLAPGGKSRNFWGFAGVAQLAEQLPCKQQVAGSNPTASSSWLVVSIVVVRGWKWSRRGSRAAKGSRL